MRCAIRLNQKISADYIFKLINKAIADQVKDNQNFENLLMVIDIVEIKNEATFPQET